MKKSSPTKISSFIILLLLACSIVVRGENTSSSDQDYVQTITSVVAETDNARMKVVSIIEPDPGSDYLWDENFSFEENEKNRTEHVTRFYIFYDSRNRIKKLSIVGPHEAEGDLHVTEYFDNKGNLCYVKFRSSYLDEKNHYGYSYIKNGSPVKTSSRITQRVCDSDIALSQNCRNVEIKDRLPDYPFHLHTYDIEKQFKLERFPFLKSGYYNRRFSPGKPRTGRYASIGAFNVNVRDKASINGKVLFTTGFPYEFDGAQVLSESDKERIEPWGTHSWYKLQFDDKTTGYIFGAFFEPVYDEITKSGPDEKWPLLLEKSHDDYINSITVDSCKNIYIVYSTETGCYGYKHAGKGDIYLLKYDHAGNRKRVIQIASENEDLFYGIVTDENNNVYVNTAELVPEGSDKEYKNYIIRYDSSGKKLWSRQIDSKEGSPLYSDHSYMAIDKENNLCVSGIINDSSGHFFISRYDADGNILLTRNYDFTGSGYQTGLAVDNKGNIYVTGVSVLKKTNDSTGSTGTKDIYVRKFNAALESEWSQVLSSELDDESTGIKTDSEGNVYVTGYTDGSLDGHAATGTRRTFLVKYSSAGKKLWLSEFDSGSVYQSIAVDKYNNIYICGFTEIPASFDGIYRGMYEKYNMFIVMYNSSGIKKWTSLPGYSESAEIAVDANCSLYFTADGNRIFSLTQDK